MAFVPHVTDDDRWKDHFVKMSQQNTKQKKFYSVKPNQKGSGEKGIVVVSPTEQDVARAKSDIKYKRNATNETNHSATRDRTSNIPFKKRKK